MTKNEHNNKTKRKNQNQRGTESNSRFNNAEYIIVFSIQDLINFQGPSGLGELEKHVQLKSIPRFSTFQFGLRCFHFIKMICLADRKASAIILRTIFSNI